MKKLFIVLAVASLGFVACNNDAAKTETPDSTAVKIDSPAAMTPDTSKMAMPDTTKKDTAATKM